MIPNIPEGMDPLNVVAAFILDKEEADDVIIIVTDKKGRLDISNALKDRAIDTNEKQKAHVLKLLKGVVKELESKNPNAIESFFSEDSGKSYSPFKKPGDKPSEGDSGSISVTE